MKEILRVSLKAIEGYENNFSWRKSLQKGEKKFQLESYSIYEQAYTNDACQTLQKCAMCIAYFKQVWGDCCAFFERKLSLLSVSHYVYYTTASIHHDTLTHIIRNSNLAMQLQFLLYVVWSSLYIPLSDSTVNTVNGIDEGNVMLMYNGEKH